MHTQGKKKGKRGEREKRKKSTLDSTDVSV